MNSIESMEKEREYLDSIERLMEKELDILGTRNGKRDKIIEVNTGALVDGCKKMPYPAPLILSIIKELENPFPITTDCHDKRYLSYGMEDARNMLKAMGFKTTWFLETKASCPSPSDRLLLSKMK